MLKKILFPIIALFLAYRSYELGKSLWLVDPDKIGVLLEVFVSVLLNLFVTGIFAFVGFAYPTNRILGERYYRVSNPKLITQLSKHLGIGYFKRFLLLVFWGKKKNRQKYFDGTKLGLDNFDFQTRQSEFGHLAALVTIQTVAILLLIKGHNMIALYTTLLNIFANFYPVLLQRSHRVNITRLRNILSKRPTA